MYRSKCCNILVPSHVYLQRPPLFLLTLQFMQNKTNLILFLYFLQAEYSEIPPYDQGETSHACNFASWQHKSLSPQLKKKFMSLGLSRSQETKLIFRRLRMVRILGYSVFLYTIFIYQKNVHFSLSRAHEITVLNILFDCTS